MLYCHLASANKEAVVTRTALPPLAAFALSASLVAGAAAAQTIAVDGGFFVTPDQPVTAHVNYLTNCFRSHEVEVVPRTDSTPLVRVIAVEGCTCPASVSRPFTFTAELGTYPPGVYRVELVAAPREEGSPLPCTPPTVLAATELVVSNSGAIQVLAVHPPTPRPGQPVTLEVRTVCGAVWGAPEFSGTASERIIRLGPPPAGSGAGSGSGAQLAPRLTPCGSDPNPLIPLGPLPAGVYRVALDNGAVTSDVERRFVVAPEPGPPLLLHDGRFRVRGTWRSAQNGSGPAQPGTLTDQTGYHWFFQNDNVETIVKVIDGCALNNRFWVFLAGLTNVETHLTVEDTVTGEVWSHTNLLGTPFAPVQDTNALMGCAGGK
jgi:hypothetical protein